MKKVYGILMLLAGVLFISTESIAQYCTPRTSGSWDGITKVVTTGALVNISKSSSNTIIVNNYTSSDSVSTNFGQSFTISVSHYLSCAIFVDWNDDGDFF